MSAQTDAEQNRWRFSAQIAFRFGFCYLVLYCLYILAGEQQLFRYFISDRFADSFIDPFWHHVVPWVGKHILHLRTYITIFSNGSGDTTYDYVLILCELFVAAVATVIWSALDRKRPNYHRLYAWLRFVVRLVLAMEMFAYGMDKAIPVQFGSLTLTRLSRRVGDLTPFDLLWTFMAASKPYTIFGGIGEVLAGVLLLTPRLTTLGALIAIGVMTNVFALNMSYDVPVKLASFHYLLMAAFLVIPDAQRLINLLVLNRPTVPRVSAPLSNRPWINRSTLILPGVIAVAWLLLLTHFSLKRYAAENPPASALSPLYGVWNVDEFNVTARPSGNAVPLLTAKLASEMTVAPGEDRWTELVFDSPGTAGIRLSNGLLDYVTVKLDPQKNTAAVTDDGDPNWKCDFVYQRIGDQQLTMQGHINGNTVSLKLRRLDQSKSRLTTRGFHWINEFPF